MKKIILILLVLFSVYSLAQTKEEQIIDNVKIQLDELNLQFRNVLSEKDSVIHSLELIVNTFPDTTQIINRITTQKNAEISLMLDRINTAVINYIKINFDSLFLKH